MKTSKLIADHVMATYPRTPITFSEGKGFYLFDDKGDRYLDFMSGVAVVSIGHSHPAVIEAVTKQIGRLTHVSNLYETEPMALLAERLCGLLGWADGKVFFANSGAEANEAALKVVRRWAKSGDGSQDLLETIAAEGSFHGRTMQTLAATGQPAKWERFAPLPEGFVHVPYDDLAALESAITPQTSSVLLEPIQGEGGVVVPSDDYLPGARALCDSGGLAFIADEVQTGLCRTGEWFGFQHWGAIPDVITLAKALGNGLPIGVCIARGDMADALETGDHGTTLGGGPVVCAAALATLDVMESEGLAERAAYMGVRLAKGLDSLAGRAGRAGGSALASGVRGMGLLQALVLSEPVAGDVVKAALSRKLLVNQVTPHAVRLCPPLTIDEQACDEALSILEASLEEVGRG
jgi:acetylornithine aminotransferase